MTNVAETITGKKFNQDPKYRVRRAGAYILMTAGLAGVALVGNRMADAIQGTHPTQIPAAEQHQGDYKVYKVKGGDTLSGIVHEAFPKDALYGDKFEQEENTLAEQLPANDQLLGTLQPGEHLTLSPDAAVGDLKTPDKTGI